MDNNLFSAQKLDLTKENEDKKKKQTNNSNNNNKTKITALQKGVRGKGGLGVKGKRVGQRKN